MGKDLQKMAKLIIRMARNTQNVPEEWKEDELSALMIQRAQAFLGSISDDLSQVNIFTDFAIWVIKYLKSFD